MMGRDHAALGALVALGAGRLAGLSAPELLCVAGTVAGAALLPDLDEPGSSVAHMMEPVSGAVAAITKRIAGGHRKATHSLIGLGVVTGLTVFLAHVSLTSGVPASIVMVGIAYAIAARALFPVGLRPGHLAALVIGAAGAYATWRYVGLGWAPWAIAGGVAMHFVGDILTKGGVPLFWPNTYHVEWPVLGHTDSGRERVVGIVMIAAVVGLAWLPVATLAPHALLIAKRWR